MNETKDGAGPVAKQSMVAESAIIWWWIFGQGSDAAVGRRRRLLLLRMREWYSVMFSRNRMHFLWGENGTVVLVRWSLAVVATRARNPFMLSPSQAFGWAEPCRVA